MTHRSENPGDSDSRHSLILERFEQAWQSGQPPSIAEHLAGQDARGEAEIAPPLLSELVAIDLERRWRAARQAGLTEVPAVIRTVDDERLLTEALIENLQREDLTPLEEGAAYKSLLEEYGLTHEQVADRVGKSRSAVTNAIRLLGLPAKIQALLETGDLRQGHARALLGLEDRTYAVHIAQRAVDEGWSVRQVEDAVRQRQESPSEPQRAVVKEVRPVEIIELEQRLTEALGTKVSIDYRKKKGRVHINFASLDELERIYRTIFG